MHVGSSHDNFVCLGVVRCRHLFRLLEGGTSNYENDEILRTVLEVKGLCSRELLSRKLACHCKVDCVAKHGLVSQKQVLNFVHLEETLSCGSKSLLFEKLSCSLLLASVLKDMICKSKLLIINPYCAHFLLQLVDKRVIFVPQREKD